MNIVYSKTSQSLECMERLGQDTCLIRKAPLLYNKVPLEISSLRWGSITDPVVVCDWIFDFRARGSELEI